MSEFLSAGLSARLSARLPAGLRAGGAPGGHTRAGATAAAVLVLTVLAVLAALVWPPASAARQQARGAAGGNRLGECGAGHLCLWERPDFKGKRLTFELSGTDIESCVPLPSGFAAGSHANRTGRPVTTYQSAECASTGEFHTHPNGSWTPETAYEVRAFQIWER